MIVCNYYGSLVYGALYNGQKTTLTLGEWFMEFLKDTFHICASYSHEKVLNEDIVKPDGMILPARFWAIDYINDGRKFPRDDILAWECVRSVRKNSMKHRKNIGL